MSSGQNKSIFRLRWSVGILATVTIYFTRLNRINRTSYIEKKYKTYKTRDWPCLLQGSLKEFERLTKNKKGWNGYINSENYNKENANSSYKMVRKTT